MKVEVAVFGSPSPNSPYGLLGRKATLGIEGGPVWPSGKT